jgi:LPXTG-site transpeptidase (sortase) family protein
VLIAAGIGLIATALPGLGVFHSTPSAVASQSVPAVIQPLSVPHQRVLPGTGSTSAAGPNQVIAYITIPKLGIKSAPIYDRGLDSKGNMLIANGYAVTHYAFSSAIGSGNAVLYGHDDIQGSIFARLKDLQAGDEVDVQPAGGAPIAYRVVGRSIVAPTAVQILQPTNDVRLTLFTCWPNWVDTQRVVVTATPVPAA